MSRLAAVLMFFAWLLYSAMPAVGMPYVPMPAEHNAQAAQDRPQHHDHGKMPETTKAAHSHGSSQQPCPHGGKTCVTPFCAACLTLLPEFAIRQNGRVAYAYPLPTVEQALTSPATAPLTPSPRLTEFRSTSSINSVGHGKGNPMSAKITLMTAVLSTLITGPLAAQEMKGMDHSKMGMPMGDSVSTKAFEDANARMHRDMAIKYSGDTDVDFVRSMIPHHQGAIDMAKVELAHGKDPEIRKLAEAVIKAQEAEIADMQAWLKAHGK